MLNYIDVLTRCYPDAQVYVLATGDPTVYDDLIWISAPINKTTIDAAECVTTNFNSGTGEELQPAPTTYEGGISMVFNYEGAASNRWLSHEGHNGLDSNKTPGIIPWDATLSAITFTNKKDRPKTNIEIYSAPIGGGKDEVKQFTWEIRELRVASKTNFITPVTFNAGDKIAIYLKDAGLDPESVVIKLYLSVDSTENTDNEEKYGGDF